MLREAGAKVSIDDFGTGFSSLSALAEIIADELKIDRYFITDVHRRPRSQSVLKAIEALGHSLGMSIVVEGVESFEEVAYLQAASASRKVTISRDQSFSMRQPPRAPPSISFALPCPSVMEKPRAGFPFAAELGADRRAAI